MSATIIDVPRGADLELEGNRAAPAPSPAIITGRPMRLAYIGNHDTPATSESIWSRAFEQLGHEVIKIRHDEASERGDDVFARIIADRPNVVFYSRTHNHTALKAEPWTKRWRAFEDLGIRTCGLHLDLFFGLEEEREALVTEGDPLFTMELVCTPDGGHQAEFEAAGVNHRWLPPALDIATCYLGEPIQDLVCDVMFVGSRGYHPAYPERPALIDALNDYYGPSFVHVGPDGVGVYRGHALNQAIASAKVVVGDGCFALNPSLRVAKYWSDRVPEHLGRGALVVHPPVEGLREWHPSVVQAKEPGGIPQMLSTIDDVLNDWSPEARFLSRRDGYEACLRAHTYNARAAQVLNWVMEMR